MISAKTFSLIRFNVLLIAVFIPNYVLGQNEQPAVVQPELSEHTIGLGIGINDFHQKDLYLTSFIYHGAMFSSRIAYQYKSQHTRHFIDLHFSTGHTNSDVQPQKATQYVGSASYSYVRSLYPEKGVDRQFELFLGAGLSSDFATTDMYTQKDITWYGSLDKTWYWSHALDLLLLCEFRIFEDSDISAKIGVPVFRLVSRNDYRFDFSKRNIEVRDNFLKAAEGTTSEWFWDYLVFFSELEYRQHLSDDFDIYGIYSFQYFSTNKSQPIRMYMNNFLVGIYWLL